MPHRFSNRLQWDAPVNPLRAAVDAYRRGGRQLRDLTLSNPTRAAFAPQSEAVGRALQEAARLPYRPDPRGLLSARQAVARYYRHQHRLAVDPEHIILTASTSEAYAHCFRLFCDPGDAMLVPRPGYPLFDYLAGLESVRLVPYYARNQLGSWLLDPEAIRETVTATTRAILAVHPNNPTGACLKQSEWHALTDLGLPLIVDEVFLDYPLAPPADAVPSRAAPHQAHPTVVLGGLSKAIGAPGLKLGWIVVQGPPAWRGRVLHHLELIADTFLSVNTPVQAALPTILTEGRHLREQIRRRTATNLDRLRNTLRDSPVSLLEPEAGWNAILRFPALRSDESWAIDLVRQAGVLMHPGYLFDIPAEAHLVCSLLPPEDAFQTGIAAAAHAANAIATG